MPSYYLINSFQCPNFTDEFCYLLSGSEFKLFYITFRKTIADLNKRNLKPEDRKAGIAYSEFRKLTGLSKSTIAKDLKVLVEYKVILPLPGPISRKTGQEYRLNVVVETNRQRGKATQIHLSHRLMNMEGLRQRKAGKLEKNRQKTTNARKNRTTKRSAESESYRSVKQTANASYRSVKQTDSESYQSVKQTAYRSVKQTDHNQCINQGVNAIIHPHHTPLDPLTGTQQKPDVVVSEQQTIFQYLERKLKEDRRVQENPPIQSYDTIFTDVMTLRKITVWELQQLITGILADNRIENPIGALRSPDTFRTEKYLFIEKEEEKIPVSGVRQGDVWQRALRTLEQKINRPSFDTWLRPTHLFSMTDHTVHIGVPDQVYTYWLSEHYENVIKDVLSEELGFQPEIVFVVDPQQTGNSDRPTSTETAS